MHAAAGREPWTLPLQVTLALWVLVLFDVHLFLQSLGGGRIAASLPKPLYLGVLGLVLTQGKTRRWYPPLLAFFLTSLVMIPFATNTGFTRALILKTLALYYVLAVGSLTFIRTPDKVVLLIRLFLASFCWYWLMSRGGRVSWHPDLANEDSFGPFMAIGIGYAYCLGLASKGWARWACFALSVICTFCVVESFARGAFVAAVGVLVYLWLRLPYKGRNLLAVCLGALAIVAAESLFFGGKYWAEMMSSMQGDPGRQTLWHGAWLEFLQNPIFGVGAGNFGPYAEAHLGGDPIIANVWQQNQLWGIQLHNIFMQVLCEFGLVGSAAAVWMLVDFWRRNLKLRSARLVAAWRQGTSRALDLRWAAAALEVAMVGFLLGGLFYNQLYIHWFYTILLLNAMLHAAAERLVAAAPGGAGKVHVPAR